LENASPWKWLPLATPIDWLKSSLERWRNDMIKRFAAVLAGAMLLGTLAPIPAAADIASVCTGTGPGAGIVTACTALLATGKLDKDSQVVALSSRGNAYEGLGQHQKAIDDYTAAIAIAPSADLYFARAYANEQMGQDTPAIADYTQAITLNANDVPALTRRGFAYLRGHDYVHAQADFNAALTINPAAPFALEGRGVSYVGLSKYDLATADFTSIINATPTADAYLSRAQVEFYQAHWADSAADFGHVLALKPGDASSLLWQHITLVRAGQSDPNFATAAAALDPQSFFGKVASFFLGKTDQQSLFAVASTGQLCAAEIFVGESFEMAKQHGTAVINFQQAINPSSPMCSYGTFEYQVALTEMSR
jgi:tetratricopeptide (TPR) repeat protein